MIVCHLSYLSPYLLLVLAAGDAAHVIRPTGQGANLALEDAVMLAASIAQHGVNESALREFEAARLPRWRLVSANSWENATAAYEGRSPRVDNAAFFRQVHSIDFPTLKEPR